MLQRAFDVVVYGATGFTGQLVAEYLALRHPGLRWAIAGRDVTKLERLRARLSAIDPALSELKLLTADSADGRALRALAEQTVALCSTVGPFARYGSELVAACVERGTHYCDITGEVQWVKRMIAQHHASAAARGVRVVPSCGYDSIPSDLGVFVLQQHARQQHGGPSRDVHALAHVGGSQLSGGTVASMLNLVDEALSDPEVRRVLRDPFALTPDPGAADGSRHEQRGPGYQAAARVFTAPFMMAPANVRIVHRSNALLGYTYGRDFSYREAMPTGKGVRGAARSLAFSAGMFGLELGLALPPTRALVRRAAPEPGTGPSPRARERAFFAHEFYGAVRGKRLRARFAADGDPGYGETAKMLSESVVSLALDAGELSSSGGVLTAASALGARLVERLRGAGISIAAWTEPSA